MSNTFRLAHLSDLHLGPIPTFWPWHWNFKRMLGFTNWMHRRRHMHYPEFADLILDDIKTQNIDHIAISGDLINIGIPLEYRRALVWLKRAGSFSRVSVVPGNHDLYSQLWYDPGIGHWSQYMTSTIHDHVYDTRTCKASNYFPFVRRWRNIALIGINSAILTNIGSAFGAIGTKQLLLLKAILEDLQQRCVYRIIMLHHPPFVEKSTPYRNLRDAKQLINLLMTVGVELVIHGHEHKHSLAYYYWNQKPFPVIGVPSCSASLISAFPASYNVYVFTTVENCYQLELIQRQILPDANSVGEVRRQRLIPQI
ncbi:MAG: metallophosphoesterase [Hyphomicrobiaceae bacterium]|nr:metallophosphoesterase [Hyphomicrobiaceae bacterium]